MNTDDLIERLGRHPAPVTPLLPPLRRTALWAVGTIAYLGILALVMTSRADVMANGSGWRFLLPQVAAVATSVAAAFAAFTLIVPGYATGVLWWPAAAALIWIGGLVLGSVAEWNQAGSAALASPQEWLCVVTIVMGGALPAWGMAVMLRRGAPLAPRLTTALTVLAASGLANVTACVSHPHTSSALILAWHGSTILMLVALATWSGRLVFAWDSLAGHRE